MKLKFTLTLNQARKQNVKIDQPIAKGLFIWIGSHNAVDRIIGYHFKRGFIADYCYATHNHWIKDLYLNMKCETGFCRIIRFI